LKTLALKKETFTELDKLVSPARFSLPTLQRWMLTKIGFRYLAA